MDKRTAPASSEEVDIGPLNQSLGFLVRMAQLKIFGHFFGELGDRDIRPGEHCVLLLIARNPGVRQGLVAERLMIKRAHMTKLVRALEKQGLVERTIPEADRRAVELRLTAKGEMTVRRDGQLVAENEATLPSPLTADESAELHRLLQKFTGQGET